MRRIGTQRELGRDERQRLVDELTYWHDNSTQFYAERDRAAAMFNCEWEGQHISGTVRDRGERKAFPFKGASDQRLRWGKGAVKELAALLMNATKAASVGITCTKGPREQDRANALTTLLEWAVSRMGVKWETQLRTALTYYLRDTPAVAMVRVIWAKRVNVAVAETDVETLHAEYVAARMADGTVSMEQAEGEYWLAVQGIQRLEGFEGEDAEAFERAYGEVVRFIAAAKGVEKGMAERILRGVAEDPDGEVEYTVESVESEGPELRALRYGDDFCLPTLTEEFDYAEWFDHEWMTRAQLEEKVATEGWSREWVRETLEHPGENIFNQMKPEYIDEEKEMYDVVRCHFATADGEGRVSRWECVLSQAEGSAYGKRLARTRRGKWDAVLFRREINSSNVIDAEGIAEESAPVQGVAKVIRDGAANNAIVGAQPPIKIKGRNIKGMLIGPFRKITGGYNDDALFMQPPQYPAAADKQVETIRSEFLQFEGLGDKDHDTSGQKQDIVNWWLAQLQELYRLLLEVTQDNASDETLAGITNAHDIQGLRREDIAGDFGITVVLDQNDLDNERLIKKLQTFAKLVQPLDRTNALDTYPVLMDAMRKLLPGVAKASMKTPGEMAADDVKDEMQNFVQIKAGVMPQMDTEGRWNYRARLDFYRNLQEQNPAAFEEMGETSREMLQRWMEALEQQAQQFGANAEIGRTGVRGVAAQQG